MFIANGIVYGGTPDTGIKVQSVKALDDMIMIIKFSNGETRLFDATALIGPVYEPLKDEKIFKNITIDHGVITWKDGMIDCAPEYMYQHSYEYSYDNKIAV